MPFMTRWGYGGHILDLTPGPHGGGGEYREFCEATAYYVYYTTDITASTESFYNALTDV